MTSIYILLLTPLFQTFIYYFSHSFFSYPSLLYIHFFLPFFLFLFFFLFKHTAQHTQTQHRHKHTNSLFHKTKKKMVSIRRATTDDLPDMQHCNLSCLPENYEMKYYLYHELSWPQISFVAETIGPSPRIVGYVLGKMEEDAEIPHGHITSISVLRSFRRLGIATRLLRQAHECMFQVFGAKYVSLHVRVTNVAAKNLYMKALHYEIAQTENGYYADGENALLLKCNLSNEKLTFPVPEEELVPPPHISEVKEKERKAAAAAKAAEAEAKAKAAAAKPAQKKGGAAAQKPAEAEAAKAEQAKTPAAAPSGASKANKKKNNKKKKK